MRAVAAVVRAACTRRGARIVDLRLLALMVGRAVQEHRLVDADPDIIAEAVVPSFNVAMTSRALRSV